MQKSNDFLLNFEKKEVFFMSGNIFSANTLEMGVQQSQQQRLTMKQRQALELLFLSRPELESKLSEALLTNPLLETVEHQEDLSELPSGDDTPEMTPTEDESLYEAQAYESSDEWLESLPIPGSIPTEASSSAEDFLLYTAAPEQKLRENLMSELNLCQNLDEKIRSIAETLIIYLDDDGFLRTPLEDIAMTTFSSMEETEKALQTVQQFDPPGVAARSLQESLLLQLKRSGGSTPLFEKLLNDEFENLKRNRLDLVSLHLGISLEELEQMFLKLRQLNPSPVIAENKESRIVYPEVEIYKDENGNFAAELLKERRTFKLSGYADMINAPDAGEDFAQKVREGKNLLEALEFRKSTILRMAEMLIALQRPFLEHGAEKLLPLTMKQAAEFLNFKSESTVSRAAASKYVKTPHGVLPFKYFFTSGYVSEEGNQVSRTADMELLKKLIEQEDKKAPLSDEKLSQLLNEAGHPVARRTVVKYREKMNIPNSTLRKEHF